MGVNEQRTLLISPGEPVCVSVTHRAYTPAFVQLRTMHAPCSLLFKSLESEITFPGVQDAIETNKQLGSNGFFDMNYKQIHRNP